MKKIIYIVLGTMGVVVLLYFLLFFKTAITFNLEPENTSIKVDDLTLTNHKKFKVWPGKHQLVISSKDYLQLNQEIKLPVSQTLTVNIKLNKNAQPISLSNSANFPAFTADGKSLLFLANAGKTIYKIDNIEAEKPTEVYAVTPDVFSNIDNILWSPDRGLVIMNKGEEKILYDFKRYDLLHQESFNWGKGIYGLAWSPMGDKIIYYYEPGTGEKSLIRANKDNSEIERVIDLRNYNLTTAKISWSSDGKKVLLASNDLYIFDVYFKTIKQLEKIKNISDAQFTPDSQNIVYQQTGKLYLTDLEGENSQDLNIAANLDKTAWSDDSHIIYFGKDSKNQITLQQLSLEGKDLINYDYSGPAVNIQKVLLSNNKQRLFILSNQHLYYLDLVNKKYSLNF